MATRNSPPIRNAAVSTRKDLLNGRSSYQFRHARLQDRLTAAGGPDDSNAAALGVRIVGRPSRAGCSRERGSESFRLQFWLQSVEIRWSP